MIDGEGVVTVVGRSMWPLLAPGSRVTIRPLVGLPRLGTILVYEVGDQLVVHRLVRVQRWGDQVELVTKGDLSAGLDKPIELRKVIGQAVRIESSKRSLSLDNTWCRTIGWCFATCAAPVIAVGRLLWRKAMGITPVIGRAGLLKGIEKYEVGD